MKQTSIAIGITALLILTSIPYSRADQEPAGVAGGIHWVNPDGSKGIADLSTVSRRTLAWGHPDGTQGVVERHSEPLPAFEYVWVNPDGHRSTSMIVLNRGDANKLASKPAVATRYNDQQLHEITKADRPMTTLNFLLMLVAGVSFLLIMELWRE